MPSRHHILLALAVAGLLAGSARAADLTASLKKGTPELKSAGALAFGPQGILFIGDSRGAAIFAVDTGDRSEPSKHARPKVEGIDSKIASLLGVEAKQLLINDLAVNPISGNTYLSVSRGRGPDAKAVVMRVSPAGKVSEFSLKDVKFSRAHLPNPPRSNPKARWGDPRNDAITHLAYVKGRLLVAGLSNEEFASKLRSIPFPFTKVDKGTSVEIFHGAHGQLETRSPVRVFAPYKIKGKDHLLAAYTCTPLVKFPVADLEPGKKVKGITIAELGNRNRPLAMIVYKKGGKDYILMANNARGLMKIPLEGVATVKGITEHVEDKAGLKYTTIKSLKGVHKLDAYGKGHAVVLLRTADGPFNLQTIELP
jgi:hypothetical protein